MSMACLLFERLGWRCWRIAFIFFRDMGVRMRGRANSKDTSVKVKFRVLFIENEVSKRDLGIVIIRTGKFFLFVLLTNLFFWFLNTLLVTTTTTNDRDCEEWG